MSCLLCSHLLAISHFFPFSISIWNLSWTSHLISCRTTEPEVACFTSADNGFAVSFLSLYFRFHFCRPRLGLGYTYKSPLFDVSIARIAQFEHGLADLYFLFAQQQE